MTGPRLSVWLAKKIRVQVSLASRRTVFGMRRIAKVALLWETVLDQFASKEEPNWEVFLSNRLEDICLPLWSAAGRARPRPLSLLCKVVLATLSIASYAVAASLLLIVMNAVFIAPAGVCLVAAGWLVFGAQGAIWGAMGAGCLVALAAWWHNQPHREPRTSGSF